MAIQGSGLEAALGTPRYSSGLHCVEDIFVRHGPLAFWQVRHPQGTTRARIAMKARLDQRWLCVHTQGLVPMLYSELVPQAMATTFTSLVFNAFAYLRDE